MESINELEQWISGIIPKDPFERDRDYSPILRAIEDRVAFHLDRDPSLLMSYLYRLDVKESLVRKVLSEHSSSQIVNEIAKLIFDRQMQRLRTKRQYGKTEIDDEEWSW